MPFRPLISKIRVHHPNKKGSANANRNYVKYIATREGVSLESVEDINALLRAPGMMETDLKEELVHQEADNQSYVQYMARRPRSQGLFGNVDTSDLKQVSSDIAELTKNGKIIYRGVISLSEKDAEVLGFRNVNAWNGYLRSVMPMISQKLGLSSYNYTWVAAFHAEESHPHVHYMLWDNGDKVRSPYIHTATQQAIRISLEKEMFDNEYERAVRQVAEHELEQLNQSYNQNRTGILKGVEGLMREIGYVEGAIYERLPARPSTEYLQRLAAVTEEFVEKLPGKGRLAYQYLTPEMKEHMAQIIDMLLEKPEIQSAMKSCLDSVRARNALYGSTSTKTEYEVKKQEGEIRKRIANKILSQIKPVVRQEHALHDEIYKEQEGKSRAELSSVQDETEAGVELSSVQDETEAGAELSSVQDEIEAGTEPSSVVEEELEGRVSWLEKWAAKGALYVLYELGKIYTDPENGKFYNIKRGIECFERLAEHGSQSAKYRLGAIYTNSYDKEIYDVEKAAGYLQELADGGHEYAQYRLGVIYADEQNRELYDLQKAVEYLEKSAEKGNEYAQYRLGVMYADVQNRELYDLEKSVDYLRKSAEQGHEYAQYRLGAIYADRASGSFYSVIKAAAYFETLAKQGNEYAQYHLGALCVNPDYPEVYNLQKGIAYLEAAARQENMHAQCKLGMMYYFGKEVEKNVEKGKFWLERAAEHGSPFARDILEHEIVGMDFSYCLLKGVLSSLEGMTRQMNQDYADQVHTQSAQAKRDRYLHRDKEQGTEIT